VHRRNFEPSYQRPGDTHDLLDRCEQKVFAIKQQRRVAMFQHISPTCGRWCR
jgi:replicative DNA helicase